MSLIKLLVLCMATMAMIAGANSQLPKGLNWESNTTDPIFASPEAQRGGTFNTFLMTYPMTLRVIGPNSNGSFRSAILGNSLSPVAFHPNTGKLMPMLAEKWAFGKDRKTIYFKLKDYAKWSDGRPVTSEDFQFSLEMMRSKNIQAPWYNTYYKEQYDKVIVFDKLTFALVAKLPKSKFELVNTLDMRPFPKHFYKTLPGKDFTKKYNWKIAPNNGPYIVSKIKKGKSITFKRKANWWGNNDRFFKYRFNPDKVVFKLIRDFNIAYEHFKKGKFEAMSLVLPKYWHEKATGTIYDKGYVKKIWFYVDAPQPDQGVWLNQDYPLLKDKNVREGILYSLNLQKVIKSVLRGDYQRSETTSMGYGAYTNPNIKARRFNIKKANAFFNKAGFKTRGADGIRVNSKGERLSVRFTYGAPHHTERLTVIKEEAKKTGLEITLQLLDANASFKTMLEKKHQIAWTGWGAQATPQFWGSYHSVNAHKPQTNNFSNMDDKKLDVLIEKFRDGTTDKVRASLAHKIQKMIYESAAYTPTFMVPYVRTAYWRYWKLPKVPGTKISDGLFAWDALSGGLSSFGGLFWLDTAEKAATKKAMKSGKKFAPETRIIKKYKM